MLIDKEDYFKTINVCGTDVEIGIDDYGQCYYIKFFDDKNDIREISLGAYNSDYMEEIYSLLDPRYKRLTTKECLGTLTVGESAELHEYWNMFDKEYENIK